MDSRELGSRMKKPRDEMARCLLALLKAGGKYNERPLALSQFPPRLAETMWQLYAVSIDPTHKDFIRSQDLIHEIVFRRQGLKEILQETRPQEQIEVYRGRLDVALPGGAGKEGEAPGPLAPVTSPKLNGNGSTHRG